MSRSPIQVSDEVKEQLEILKTQMRCSSLSDVISKLCEKKVEAESFEVKVRHNTLEEAKRVKNECIMVGEQRKSQVVELKEQLGLGSEAYTIDFLLDVFWTSDKIDRSVLMGLINLR